MAKLDFVKNGVVTRLPPGFRFHPTDEELVVQYLKRKVFSVLLPANIISEVDVCKFDPWDLPGNLEEERYFFSRNEVKHLNGKRSKRGTDSGYWKATGIDKQILTSRNSQVVGKKKTLVFYRGKPPNDKRTDWIMHEYGLSLNEASEKSSTQSLVVPVKNWVLCRIFLKKRSTKNMVEEQELSSICDGSSEKAWTNRPVLYNFMTKVGGKDLNLPPPSSCSSGVTEISSDKFDEQEESSSGNNGCSFDLTRRFCSST